MARGVKTGGRAAESSTAERKPRGRPFQKGQSGNPGGRPKGLAEVKDLARKYTRDAVKALAWEMRHGESGSARVAAAQVLLDRGWGKPTQALEIDAKVTDRHEYDITQRIIADPGAAEIARSLLARVAGGDAGLVRVDGEPGPLEAR